MVRSAAAVLALLILPSFALSQQAGGTHTVVDGDTLWDLAQRYYASPFDWRRIWEANRQQVADPNLILPGWSLVIPGREAQVSEVVIDTPVGPAAREPIPTAAGNRTVFFQDTSVVRAGVTRVAGVEFLAVPHDLVLSAPWIVDFGTEPQHDGVIAGRAASLSRGETMRSYDQIRVSMDSPARVGDQLQIFRVTRAIEDVGSVVEPTGIVTVAETVEGGIVGIVTKEFGRIGVGDFVGPLPIYRLSEGQYAQAVSGGSEAMVMGFVSPAALQDIGHVAFLDLGSDNGVTVGDEFVLFNRAVTAHQEGSLQVIGVRDQIAAARIVAMEDVVWRQGVVVRLTKKMR